ncbi:MAG: hypothetical protein IPL52_01670 [Flavobacteriales bacterium]|nr:hypothetical protein [Flavobacteriales bacterium]
MNKILALCALSLIGANGLFAQAPEKMSFQAVLRDGADDLIVNSAVGMRTSILQGSSNGSAVYVETHAPTTNANGLATVEIGAGTVVSGDFATIDWANGPYYLKTETDPDGGTTYSITGTSQLLSVPYALYAGNSEPGPPGPPGMPGVGGCDPNDRDSLIVLYNNAQAHGFYQDVDGVGHWLVQNLGNTNHSAIASKRGVAVYNNSTAYAFYLDNAGIGAWSTQALGNTGHTAVASKRIIVLYNNSTAYAFHVDGAGLGTWTTQGIGNTGHSHAAHGDKVVVWNNSNAWSFSVDASGNGAWVAETLGGTIHEVITTR